MLKIRIKKKTQSKYRKNNDIRLQTYTSLADGMNDRKKHHSQLGRPGNV